MSVLAELVAGEADWSDVFLLVAVVLFVAAAVVAYKPSNQYHPLVGYLAAAALATGLLLL